MPGCNALIARAGRPDNNPVACLHRPHRRRARPQLDKVTSNWAGAALYPSLSRLTSAATGMGDRTKSKSRLQLDKVTSNWAGAALYPSLSRLTSAATGMGDRTKSKSRLQLDKVTSNWAGAALY